MPKMLTLKGAITNAGRVLEVDCDHDESPNPEVCLTTINDTDRRQCCYITKDQARELFNWLGIWLHTH